MSVRTKLETVTSAPASDAARRAFLTRMSASSCSISSSGSFVVIAPVPRFGLAMRDTQYTAKTRVYRVSRVYGVYLGYSVYRGDWVYAKCLMGFRYTSETKPPFGRGSSALAGQKGCQNPICRLSDRRLRANSFRAERNRRGVRARGRTRTLKPGSRERANHQVAPRAACRSRALEENLPGSR